MTETPGSLEGLTRQQVDKVESKDFALGGRPMRPRDAATLMLLEREGGATRVLMGRRHRSHAFMPGKFVFPGGRTDPDDSRVPVIENLHPEVESKLLARKSRITPARARAIALSAIRETYEEAGLLIGRRGDFESAKPHWQGFVENRVQPSLDMLRVVARAITPPGRVRRFDTRFLAAWRDDVAVELADGGPTHELEELVWLPLEEAREADIPAITKSVLGELQGQLVRDPDLKPGGQIPFFYMRYNRFQRDVL